MLESEMTPKEIISAIREEADKFTSKKIEQT